MATCYLGKQRREALDKAVEHTGWMHAHYVRIAVLEKLVADGFLSEAHVQTEVEKAEYRKVHPHGNSKRAKGGAQAGAQVVEKDSGNGLRSTYVPEPVRTRSDELRNRAKARAAARRRSKAT